MEKSWNNSNQLFLQRLNRKVYKYFKEIKFRNPWKNKMVYTAKTLPFHGIATFNITVMKKFITDMVKELLKTFYSAKPL